MPTLAATKDAYYFDGSHVFLSFDISSGSRNICTAVCVSALTVKGINTESSGLTEVSNMKEITVFHLVEGPGEFSARMDYSLI